MTSAIVITSVFSPSAAIRAFAALDGWHVIVVGDRKSPPGWSCEGVRFVSVAEQQDSAYRLARELPYDHYCRKLLGYLEAIRAGARTIVDTDDDNAPLPGWTVHAFDGPYRTAPRGLGWVNVYRYFGEGRAWPRGFPLERVRDEASVLPDGLLPPTEARVGIWQGLADGEADVDAIYRLVDNRPCRFEDRPPIVLDEGTFCPFNSQNTAFRSELFSLMYLPAFVTFRFTDILRGIVAQPILQAAGYRLGFTAPTVMQERNSHDLLADFRDEIPCYLHVGAALDAVASAVSSRSSIEDNLLVAYHALVTGGFVEPREMGLLGAWLADLRELSGHPDLPERRDS